MLSIQTINPDTLELLKAVSAQPEIKDMRLVGGTPSRSNTVTVSRRIWTSSALCRKIKMNS